MKIQYINTKDMEHYYSNDKNAQIVVSLLKAHGIKKVIASPGVTDIAIVGSMQIDDFFEMYSCVDERGAAYMACGLAAESKEPVAIVCTEATASRNYMPALTEAFYRQLPIVVITGTHSSRNTGHLFTQSIDRTQTPKDIVRCSVYLDEIKDDDDLRHNAFEVSKTLLELDHHGRGPVHINVRANGSLGFTTKTLQSFHRLYRYDTYSKLPILSKGKVVIFAGSDLRMSQAEVGKIDKFCEKHNSVVLCDHTSGYHGKYGVDYSLVTCLYNNTCKASGADLLIHIGEVSGDTYSVSVLNPKHVWRVNRDGKAKDLFRKLDCVFEMENIEFFSKYADGDSGATSLFNDCKAEYDVLVTSLPNLDFGNLWIAKTLSPEIPANSAMHFSIFNSFRSWSFFKLDRSIECTASVGGFGIDGAPSSALGSSLANTERIHYLVVGDLAFFYDLNALGNRHLGRNLRILLINNGVGVEFRKKDNPGYFLGDDADLYAAAAGHFGRKSPALVRHYAEDLGFEYLSASSKEEFLAVKDRFVSPVLTDKPILLEVFPAYNDDVKSLDSIRHMTDTKMDKVMDLAKSGVKKILTKI